MKPFLIRHLDGENENRFPVWMMRQAGRYLASYREVRKQHSFWEMVTLPQVTVDVTMQPVEQLDVDAAILFSDILTLPYGLGMPIEMRESVGPVAVQPLQSVRDFRAFEDFNPTRHTGYVGEALSILRRQLPAEKALLGFCGAPWTVACYLTEIEPTRDFEEMQRWMYRDPASLAESLALLSGASSRYLQGQIEAGADLVQVFDTWLALVPRWFFKNHYAPILKTLVSDVKAKGGRVAFYTKNANHLSDLLPELGVDLISVDSLLSLTECDRVFGGKVALQGNLSPRVLLTDEASVRRESLDLWKQARSIQRPVILNLGHGILPKTPIENVKIFLEQAKTPWN